MKHERYTGNWFPAPLEVDRYLYPEGLEVKYVMKKTFSAPLEVGYTQFTNNAIVAGNLFPAPLEVDRWLYLMSRATIYRRRRFPASLEVDRYLYEKSEYTIVYYLDKFPAPLEVDR